VIRSPIGVEGGVYGCGSCRYMGYRELMIYPSGTGGIDDDDGALRMRNRCLRELLREAGVDDDGMGGIECVDGGKDETDGTGDAGIGYKSADGVLVLEETLL